MVKVGRYCRIIVGALATSAATLGVLARPLPVVDWESTPSYVRPSSDPAYTPYVDPFFSSSKTLAETTNWLRQTIERYGDVPARGQGDDANWTGDVRFTGCSMMWASRRTSDGGTNLEERANTLKLADIDGGNGSIQVVRGQISASMRDGTVVRWTSRYYTIEGGRRMPRGEQDGRWDSSFYIELQPANDIPRRVAQALVHASRLCGGPPPH